MNILTLLPGDLLSIPKNKVLTHRGVHLWGGLVLQNTPEKGEHIVDFYSFSKGAHVTVNRTNVAPELIACRLSERLQKRRPYNAVLNNCEHTTSAITDGFAWSIQVVVWILVGLAVFHMVRER
jgi:hypothetical protein